MIYRLKNDDGSIVYPFVKEQLRSTFPNTSFPFPISDETAADFGCLPVQTIERPEHDPRTQRLVEGDPEELEDGTLRQVLTVRDATTEEIAAWDESNRPAPDWIQFGLDVAFYPEISALYSSLPVPVSNALSIGLSNASKDDDQLFAAVWGQVKQSGAISSELLSYILELADTHHLPQAFVAMLSA